MAVLAAVTWIGKGFR